MKKKRINALIFLLIAIVACESHTRDETSKKIDSTTQKESINIDSIANSVTSSSKLDSSRLLIKQKI